MSDLERETFPEPPLKPHKESPWRPNISGHRKGAGRRLSRVSLEELERRTEALKEEILGKQGESET